jgi:hypothetical protein
LELADIVSNCLAAAALTVSLVSLYFSLFHKRISLIGTLAAWNPRTDRVERCQVCEISLSNNGNRELLLRELEILSLPEREDELFPIIECDNIPAVIKPGEIKLVTFGVPNLYLQKLASEGRLIRLNFHIFTTDAKLRIATKDLCPISDEVEIPKSDWNPFKLK